MTIQSDVSTLSTEVLADVQTIYSALTTQNYLQLIPVLAELPAQVVLAMRVISEFTKTQPQSNSHPL